MKCPTEKLSPGWSWVRFRDSWAAALNSSLVVWVEKGCLRMAGQYGSPSAPVRVVLLVLEKNGGTIW